MNNFKKEEIDEIFKDITAIVESSAMQNEIGERKIKWTDLAEEINRKYPEKTKEDRLKKYMAFMVLGYKQGLEAASLRIAKNLGVAFSQAKSVLRDLFGES